MILNIVGLILSFIGSLILILDGLINFGRIRTLTYETRPWGDERIEVVKEIKTDKGYVEIKGFSIEQKILIWSLFLLATGFLLQILDFLPWQKMINYFLSLR